MDLTTIGVKVGYAVETAKDTRPTSFKQLERCKAISGINLEAESIDVTALEDTIKQYAEGMADTGGKWELTFGLNDNVITDLTALRSESASGKKDGKDTWFDVWFPNLSKSFYIKAEPGMIPLPDVGQGAAAELKISCTINKYIGLDTAIEPLI